METQNEPAEVDPNEIKPPEIVENPKSEGANRPSISTGSSVDYDDEQSISREDNKVYMDNLTGANACGFDMGNDTFTQERNEIEKAMKYKQITPGRAKLQLWLYRSMRIVMTDGRILIGIFLCTDSDANVILGVCSEFTKTGEDERMLGLVMVPGRHIVTMHLDNRCMTNTTAPVL